MSPIKDLSSGSVVQPRTVCRYVYVVRTASILGYVGLLSGRIHESRAFFDEL
jgi:hypothetical protein